MNHLDEAVRRLPPRSTPRTTTHTVQLVCPACGGASPLIARGRVSPHAAGRVLFEGRCDDCAAPLEGTVSRDAFAPGLRDRYIRAGILAARAPLDVTHVVPARVA